MDEGNSNGAVLAQCFSGLDTSGFQLLHNNGVKLAWGSSSMTPSLVSNREIIVIRHIKGEDDLHIYTSNIQANVPVHVTLDGTHTMKHNVSLVFGCNKLEDGSYEQHARGTVYWSKIWYADLGNDVCRKIAYWPHEEMKFEACFETNGTPKRYYLSDNSGMRSSMTFIASTVLSQPNIMDSSASINTGGWAKYSLNRYLNNRLYSALENQWKQLIKQVKIKSSAGDKSVDIVNSDCYIFVPSITEISSSVTGEPYSSEGTLISHFSSNQSRICSTPDGTAVQYWTRSPNAAYNNYVHRINESGVPQSVTQLNTTNIYVRIMFSM